MSPSTLILFFLFTFIQLLAPNLAHLEGCTSNSEYCWYCSNIGNYSDNSIDQKTLENLILSFSSAGNNNSGFYNVSSGQESEEVNAIGLCRGGLEPETCKTCLNDTSRVILEHCPNQKEAISWALTCMVRYSNKIIFNTRQDEPMEHLESRINVPEPNLFNRTLIPLLDSVTSRASSGDSLKKYASGQVFIPGFETIYAAGQCTPDLDKDDCSGCLDKGVSYIAQNFDGKQGARVLRPSCTLRYEIDKFFEPTSDHLILPASPTASPPASPTANPPASPNSSKEENWQKAGKSNTSRTIVAAVIPSVTVVVLIIISVCIFLKLRRKPTEKLEKLTLSEATEEISLAESLQFDLRTLRAATDNFSEENKLGQGGFGAVYKGRLDNGQYIAVKRLSKTSTQGDQEFKNEVMLVAKLHHRNLVRLLGFCLDKKERLLVYEYVPNSSLDQFIFDQIKRVELDWDKRYKIIQGIGRGLLYLHEDSRLRIIHRDLKASNILLDKEMNPKISDFGMARLFVIDQAQGDTSRIVGTYGYMAPEYLQGRFSVKSDIFSFGVLLLEIVSGEKNSCFKNGEEVEHLLTYAWKNWREGTASNLIDPTISVGSRTDIMRCIHIGLLCVQENVADRPTMNSVALMLNNQSATLAVPSKPAFFMDSYFGREMSLASNNNSEATQSDNSKSDSVQRSINEASISDLYPR